VQAEEVDQPPGHQRHPLVGVVEQLAHRNRRRRLLPQRGEVADVLRAQRVLEEEQVVRLQLAGQPDGQHRRHALVHVVQQLHRVAHLLAQVLEQPGHRADVGARLPQLGAVVGPAGVAGLAADAVGREAGHGDLGADVAEAALHEEAHALLDLLEGGAGGVDVGIDRLAALAAEQLVDGQAGALAQDVPQRPCPRRSGRCPAPGRCASRS
jgi:hypothetical protein